jgi:hypothetical protein
MQVVAGAVAGAAYITYNLPCRYRFTCGNGALRYMGISILLSCLSKYQPHKEFCTGTGFVIKIGLPSHDSSIFISTFEYLLLLASLSYATKLRENHQSPYP